MCKTCTLKYGKLKLHGKIKNVAKTKDLNK